MSMAEVREGLAMMAAGYAKLVAASMDRLTATVLLEVGDELETLTCQLPTQRHRMLARLQCATTARELGRSRGTTSSPCGGVSPPPKRGGG